MNGGFELLGIIEGTVRGYFENEKSYNGDRFLSRFLQIETENEKGEVEINKVYIPNHRDTIDFAKALPKMESAALRVNFDVKENKLFCKLRVILPEEKF